MPAPAEPRHETDATNAPSMRSDIDETAAASGVTPAGVPAVLGFDPPAAAGEVGVLGPYRVVKELGRGGMGAVYAALDTRLERRLALKMMLPEFAADANAKERFLREARAAARIKHDNVVTVYEADERQGMPYIAMEFLEGYPLDEYLKKKGSPTIPQILRIGLEAAAGLAAAHKIGLVHRDIKPANLWLEAPHGRVKVLDFGLAKPVDAEVELTKSGAVVGTPAYMSPEQARGEKVDHRTDLFSLGSVLYRLCTGRLPFDGSTTMAVLMALGVDEPRPVRELKPDVPESLAALIHQLLAKRADARPQSAAEVARRLRAIAQELAAPRANAAEVSTSQPQVMQPQVVYVATPVTVRETNPFADLDSPDTQTDSAADQQPHAEPVRAKPHGRWLWPALGFAALVALVVGGVIIIIRNKDGTETKIEVPDGSTVTVKDKNGKTLAQVGPGGKTSPATDPDRKAAEWVIGQGGFVRVSGVDGDIKAAVDLPKERFVLTDVHLDGRPVTDAGLAQLKDCKALTQLSLNNTALTDAGLANFKDCKLTGLGLGGTAVTDAGLANFKDCKGLTHLGLNKTAVTDAGLANFKDCNLIGLLLDDTKVTDKGLVNFKECNGLEHLDLSNTKVTGSGLVHFKDCKRLKIFSLGSLGITDAGLVYFKGCKELTQLSLTGKAVTDAGLANFKDCKGLTNLWLNNTAVTDAGLAHFKDCKGLTHLQLGNTATTDAGLAQLKDRQRLALLDLSNTAVTDAGLAHLKDCKNLTYLDVRTTNVTAKGLAEFHAAVPGCKIEHDGGVIEAIDVDRKAAEWVIGQGGAVRVSGQDRDTKAAADLPKDRFALAGVGLEGRPVSDAGLAHLKELKGLTVLNLSDTKVTDAGLAHLKELKKLDWLSLGGTKVTDAGLAQLKDCKGLTHLGLDNTGVTDAGLAHLKELKGLTGLYLGNTAVTDAGLTHLKDCKGLTYLDVKKTKVTAKGLEEFHAAVPGCKIEHDGSVIEAIDVDRKAAEWVIAQGGFVGVNGDGRDIKAVADLPRDRYTLTLVNLSSTKVTDTGLAHFKDCKGLMQLDLSNTKVTDAGLANFKDCKALTYLDLSSTAVTDAGLVHLKELKGLTALNLDGTAVTDVGLAHLKDCKALTGLDVRNAKVTAKGLAEFHAAVPGCKIEHDGGTIEPKK